VVAEGVDLEGGLEVVDDLGCEAEAAVDELGAVLVAAGGLEAVAAAGGLEAVAAAGGLEVVEADRALGVSGRSAGGGVTCLRAANRARLAGARATRSSTAQLPSKRRHSTDDRTLRIAQSVVA
jgi:hypothetical protein